MTRPTPSILDRSIERTKKWFRRLIPQSRSPTSLPTDEKDTRSRSKAGDDAQLINASNLKETKVDYINSVIYRREAVFKLLEAYACLDATKDSSARYPPPRCHDKTRLTIRSRLRHWLVDKYDGWKMLWVRGSAGTGKSAVAQSFGDSCEEEEALGGSYFFSRTAGRNKLKTVVPTLVYQLARCVPEYRSLIERRLAEEQLLESSPPIQFRKLITEPFATLQHQHPRKPIVIILDGLDECESESAQQEILDMITNAIQTNPDLPLRWLIFSRPEPHLKNAFSRNSSCGREELIIDAECRENVERYVTDTLIRIKAEQNDGLPADWPSPDKLQELLDAVSGLFVFASTCLNYIKGSQGADPRSQLDSLLTFIHRSQSVLSRNPLVALDLLYSRILEDIPAPMLQTTRQILAFMSYQHEIDRYRLLRSAQALANFLQLDQRTFYNAVRGLHSVMYIPGPESAARSELRMYHASFLDFLLDPRRSGKFAIDRPWAVADVIHSGIHWLEVDVAHFHTHDGWRFDFEHKHDSLPGLTWGSASEYNRRLLSQSLLTFLSSGIISLGINHKPLEGVDERLLSRISSLDFRLWYALNVFLLVQLCGLDTSNSNSAVRTEPSSPADHRLLGYFNLVIKNGSAKPAEFPLRVSLPDDRWTREYFFMGHGEKSVIIWRTKSPAYWYLYTHSLRCDQEPSQAQISAYRDVLQLTMWDHEETRERWPDD